MCSGEHTGVSRHARECRRVYLGMLGVPGQDALQSVHSSGNEGPDVPAGHPWCTRNEYPGMNAASSGYLWVSRLQHPDGPARYIRVSRVYPANVKSVDSQGPEGSLAFAGSASTPNPAGNCGFRSYVQWRSKGQSLVSSQTCPQDPSQRVRFEEWCRKHPCRPTWQCHPKTKIQNGQLSCGKYDSSTKSSTPDPGRLQSAPSRTALSSGSPPPQHPKWDNVRGLWLRQLVCLTGWATPRGSGATPQVVLMSWPLLWHPIDGPSYWRAFMGKPCA